MTNLNPFDALNQEQDTFDTFQDGEQKDATFFEIASLVSNVKVKLPGAQVAQTENPVSLLACSSKYGYFVAATANGFCLGQTKKMREKIHQAEKNKDVLFDDLIQVEVKQGKINHISLSADQLELFVTAVGGVLLTYNVHDIVHHKELASPSQVYNVGCEISSILPNPEAYPDIIAVHTKDNRCELIQNNSVIATMQDVHSICWSRKGKQIACGSSSGSILAYDIHGSQKTEITPPAAFQGGEESKRIVDTIIWLENKLFFAIYTKKEQDSDVIHTPYIVDSSKTTDDQKFVMMGELSLLSMDCPNEYFYSAVVRNLGEQAKTVIILANSAATELSVVGQDDDGKWATWMMDSTPYLPLSADEIHDTYPVGLAVDYSASEPLPPFDSAENETPVPPMPVLCLMITDGFLLCYNVYNQNLARDGLKCQDMVEAQDLYTTPLPQKAAMTTSFGNAESKIPTCISKNENLPNAFSLDGINNLTLGSSGFGSSPMKFASLAKSVSTEIKSPQLVSAFGSTSAFGQSSGFGQPAFGSTTAFGSTSTFGQSSGFGQPAFGSTTTFGSTSTFGQSSGFGQPAFGSTTAFGEAAANAPSFGGFKNMVKSPKESNSTTTSLSEISLSPSKLEPVAEPTSVFSLSVSTDKETAVSDDKNEQGGAVNSAQTAYGDEQHVYATDTEEDAGCSISFEQVQKALEENDVDVRSSGSEFSKTDSNQEDKDGSDSNIDSEKDYLDQENQSNSEQKSVNQEEKLAAEANHKLKQEHDAETERIAYEERLRLESIASEKRVAQEKQATELQRKEQERIAELQRIEQERIAELQRIEQELIAEEERLEAERLAAIKPVLKFSVAPRDEVDLEPFRRSKGLAPMAAEFEELYYSTLEEMKSTTMLLGYMEDASYAKHKHVFKEVCADTFNDFEHVWKIADVESISQIMDDLNNESKLAQVNGRFNKETSARLVKDTERLKNDKDIIEKYLDREEHDTPLETVDVLNELETKQSYLQQKNEAIDDLFEKVDSKLAQLRQQSTKSLPAEYSKMKRFELEKIVRDIRKEINDLDDKVYQLATEELNVRRLNV